MTELFVRIKQASSIFEAACAHLPRNAALPSGKRRKSKSRKRMSKRKEIKAVASKLGIDLSEHIPCVAALVERVKSGESTGFGGRKKIIGELRMAEVSENDICKIFLSSSKFDEMYLNNPIVPDNRPDPNECGFMISPVWKSDIDPKCDDVQDYCCLEKCYRAELFLENPGTAKSPTFEEFHDRASAELKKAMGITMDD